MKFSKTPLYLSRRLLYYKIFFDTKIGFKKMFVNFDRKYLDNY